MNRGAWHQCGDKSRKQVIEQLEAGHGVGVVISPRDISIDHVDQFAATCRALGAEILLDPQFYVPKFTNDNMESFGMLDFRQSVTLLNQVSDTQLASLGLELRALNARVAASAVVAPAVLYEAGRPDIVQLNARLFAMAKQAGDSLGVPTYATVGLARSVTQSSQTIAAALNSATSLTADGWYYAFEFEEERIPSGKDAVLRCCDGGLTLASTGRPVIHAYAGPMGLLSFGFGATGAAIGHSQNLWKFTRERWEGPTGQGGGGNAPPRFFSANLWGTIIYPDETVQLSPAHRALVLQPQTPFSDPVFSTPALVWKRWDAGKHMVCTMAGVYAELSQTTSARVCANTAINRLSGAVDLHRAIRDLGLNLGDDTAAYQSNWRLAMQELLAARGSDYDFLDLL